MGRFEPLLATYDWIGNLYRARPLNGGDSESLLKAWRIAQNAVIDMSIVLMEDREEFEELRMEVVELVSMRSLGPSEEYEDARSVFFSNLRRAK